MKIKCEINGLVCELPDFLIEFYTDSKLLYCSTITKNRAPYVQPTLFVNVSNKCSIVFLANSQSLMVKNLYQNKKISLTIDKIHPLNPFLNKGIMIEAISQINSSKDAIEEILREFERKYTFEVISKILGIDIVDQCVKIQALPRKIIYWEGPSFHRFKCEKQKLINA
ncbi:MAG: pyridoxamine 5'-phosphate oxidase family protein [Candidatus Thorarchaeota archaeon]